MWKTLPQQGSELREVRLEGGGKDRDLVIIPKTGEAVRFQSGDVSIETLGHVAIRVTSAENGAGRITFAADSMILERAELEFAGSESEWESMWRRARTRSRPWWQGAANEALDLDWSMPARLVFSTTMKPGRRPSTRPPSR